MTADPAPPRPRPVAAAVQVDAAPIYDEAAEQIVLGAAIADPRTIHETAAAGVTTTDFWRPPHQTLWALLLDLEHRGAPTGFVAVLAELQRTKQLRPGVLDGPYLHDLQATVPTTANAGYYATIVHDHARTRRSLEAIARTAQILRNGATGEDLNDAMAAAYTTLGLALDDDTLARAHRTPGDIRYTNFADLFANPRTDIHWLARPLLAEGRVTTIYAPGKAGKSLIAMEIACALATGRPVLGGNANELTHTLYIDQEMTPEDWHDRLKDMGYGPDTADLLTEHLHHAQLAPWPAMDTAEGGRQVLDTVRHFAATVVIIDTQSKVVAGEENSNDTFKDFYRHTLLPLKSAGAAVLVLDHTGKDIEKGARGGSAKTDNVDLAFELLQRGRDLLTLKCSHHRFRLDETDEYLSLRRHSAPLWHQIETTVERIDSIVGACLKAIAEVAPLPTDSANRVLELLHKSGYQFRKTTFLSAYKAFRINQGWDTE